MYTNTGRFRIKSNINFLIINLKIIEEVKKFLIYFKFFHYSIIIIIYYYMYNNNYFMWFLDTGLLEIGEKGQRKKEEKKEV